MIRTGSQPGIHLRLPWTSTPAHDRLKVFVRYTTRDGRKLQTERLISVALDGPPPAPRHPPGCRTRRDGLPPATAAMVAGAIEPGWPPSLGRTPCTDGPSRILYKANAAVDGAPKFALRLLSNFRSCPRGICNTAAGCRASFDRPVRGFCEPVLGLPRGRAATVCIFCAKLLHSPETAKWVSSKIPQTALRRYFDCRHHAETAPPAAAAVVAREIKPDCPPPLGLPQPERGFHHYRPPFNRCSPVLLFSPAGLRPAGEKRKKTAKGCDATSLVANPSLRLGQAQRGAGTKSTGRMVPGPAAAGTFTIAYLKGGTT